MSNLKGTDIVSVKNMLPQAGNEVLQQFLHDLSPEARDKFQKVLAVSWVPVSLASEIFEKASQVLYPSDPLALQKLARACADDHFKGIYKFLVPLFASPMGVIKRSSKLWRTFYDEGDGSIEEENMAERKAVFVVKGNPGLTSANLEFIGGWSARALEIAGAKKVNYTIEAQDPSCWKWRFAWF